jgi:hypothetical protein
VTGDFVWSHLGLLEWLVQNTVAGLYVMALFAAVSAAVGAILTPLWKRFINPFTKGGPGSRRLPDGREVHQVLAEAEG